MGDVQTSAIEDHPHQVEIIYPNSPNEPKIDYIMRGGIANKDAPIKEILPIYPAYQDRLPFQIALFLVGSTPISMAKGYSVIPKGSKTFSFR